MNLINTNAKILILKLMNLTQTVWTSEIYSLSDFAMISKKKQKLNFSLNKEQ